VKRDTREVLIGLALFPFYVVFCVAAFLVAGFIFHFVLWGIVGWLFR
jgi:hypothetical protein